MSWLIQNAHVIDPASGLHAVCDVRLNQGLIAEIGQKLERGANTQYLDAAGLTLAPGLIDTRSFHTDAPACLAGGITSLCLMPDQRMALDDPALIEHARRLGGTHLRVFPFIAATRGLQGQEMAELGLCRAAGGVAAASGRTQIANDLVAYRIAQYAQGLRLPLVAHAEILSLTQECVATEGEFATRMGLAASPVFAESMAIARDLRLVEATGVALHIPQVTTAEGLTLIRQAGDLRGDASAFPP
jgi:dihydroorotase